MCRDLNNDTESGYNRRNSGREGKGMRNEFERLLLEYGIPSGMSFLAAALRLMFTHPRESFWGALRTIFVSLVFGNLAAKLVQEFYPSAPQVVANSIIILAAISASDILPAFLKWLKTVKEDPSKLGEAISAIIPWVGRGKR